MYDLGEDVALARGRPPAGTTLRQLAAEVIAARVIAGLDAGRPGVAGARLWSWSIASTYGDGRVVGVLEPAAPRCDANGIVGVRAAEAWALEVMCGLVAEERARGLAAEDDWPGAAEAASLLDPLASIDELGELHAEAEALLERHALALEAVKAALLRRSFWAECLDDVAALVAKRRGLGRVVVPFRPRAA